MQSPAVRSPPVVAPDSPPRHNWFDNAQALITGTLFVALGLTLFRHAGLMACGTAGIALVAHLASGASFGAIYFAINLPFYVLAWRRMGRRFTLKTIVAVSLLSVLAEALPRLVAFQAVEPVFAALAGGLLTGAGMLMLFRHRASLGGLNALVLWLQERWGWRAGKVQAGVDAAILLAALPWVDARQVALSIAGAVMLNVTLAVNHKPGRYVAL